jgi:hypothetical protein
MDLCTGSTTFTGDFRELKKIGYAVVETSLISDASTVIHSDTALSCLLLAWGDGGWQKEMDYLIRLVRSRGVEAPIFLLVGLHLLEDVPIEILDHATGCVFASEYMPDFIAKILSGHVKIYAETLKTPFFWHDAGLCRPGQSGLDLPRA